VHARFYKYERYGTDWIRSGLTRSSHSCIPSVKKETKHKHINADRHLVAFQVEIDRRISPFQVEMEVYAYQ
jgi:hypothetical protein